MFLFGSSETRKWRKNVSAANDAYARGDIDTAQAHWLQAIEAARSPNGNRADFASALVHLGSLHLIAAEYGDAEKYLREALSLGNSELAAKKLEAAEYERTQLREHDSLRRDRQQVADAFVTTTPNRPNVLNNMAVPLRHQGETKWAIALLRRADRLEPNNPSFLNNLGNVLRQDGQSAEAIAVLQRSIQLRPDHPPTLNNLGYALRMRRQPKEAVAMLQRSLALRPAYPTTLNNLALALMECGDPAKARSVFQDLSSATEEHIKFYTRLVAGNVSDFDGAWRAVSASLSIEGARELREDLECLSHCGVAGATEALSKLRPHLASRPVSFMRPSAFLSFAQSWAAQQMMQI